MSHIDVEAKVARVQVTAPVALQQEHHSTGTVIRMQQRDLEGQRSRAMAARAPQQRDRGRSIEREPDDCRVWVVKREFAEQQLACWK